MAVELQPEIGNCRERHAIINVADSVMFGLPFSATPLSSVIRRCVCERALWTLDTLFHRRGRQVPLSAVELPFSQIYPFLISSFRLFQENGWL